MIEEHELLSLFPTVVVVMLFDGPKQSQCGSYTTHSLIHSSRISLLYTKLSGIGLNFDVKTIFSSILVDNKFTTSLILGQG